MAGTSSRTKTDGATRLGDATRMRISKWNERVAAPDVVPQANEPPITVHNDCSNDCSNDSNGMRSHCGEVARPIRYTPGESRQHMLRESFARRGCYVFRPALLNTSRSIRPLAVR